MKKTTEQFMSLLRGCLSRDYIDLKRVRKNSRRAREYMAAYFIASCQECKGKEGSCELTLDELKPCAVSAMKIEQMKQAFRTHRCAFDFDLSFCKIDVVVLEEVLRNISITSIT